MGWGNWQDWIISGAIFGIVIFWIVGIVVGWFQERVNEENVQALDEQGTQPTCYHAREQVTD